MIKEEFLKNKIGEEIEFYSTRYALSTGVEKLKGMVKWFSTYAYITVPKHESFYPHHDGVWLTEDEARADFENRRQKAIASAEKRLKKLRSMQFKAK